MPSFTQAALRVFLPMLFIACSATAQTNFAATTNQTGLENTNVTWALKVEEVRNVCIQNRRRICGKILKILPEGVVVDSGYTNLALTQADLSWLIPGTVPAERAQNIIEAKQPGAFCIGLVFVADLPKSPRTKPKLFDYINLEAFPAGQFSYVSVGDVRRSVRKFSTKLPKSVEYALGAASSGK